MPQPIIDWTKALLAKTQTILRRHEALANALPEISKLASAPVHGELLRKAFLRHGQPSPSSLLRQPSPPKPLPANLLAPVSVRRKASGVPQSRLIVPKGMIISSERPEAPQTL